MSQKKVQFEDCVDWYLHNPQTDESSNDDYNNANNKLKDFINKPFYCWNIKKKGIDSCCFNHMISLPIKDAQEMPLFDYEREIYDLLETKKYLWILKATGLGITEFFIRYISWRCLHNDEWKGGQVCIVTGPRLELAITLIDRMKRLFFDLDVKFQTNVNVIFLNGCKIEAYPSHHMNTMRGLTDVRMILVDEAAFFPIGEQKQVRDVAERYIAKSDPYIIMISTPNRPDDMFAMIEQEP